MKIAIAVIVVIGVSVSNGDGIELFRGGNRFSLVSLPFRYHGISPEFIDEPPKELLQVCALNTPETMSNGHDWL